MQDRLYLSQILGNRLIERNSLASSQYGDSQGIFLAKWWLMLGALFQGNSYHEASMITDVRFHILISIRTSSKVICEGCRTQTFSILKFCLLMPRYHHCLST